MNEEITETYLANKKYICAPHQTYLHSDKFFDNIGESFNGNYGNCM